MKEIPKLLLSLGLVCLIGSTILCFVNSATEKPRQMAEEKNLVQSLKLVLPKESAEIRPLSPSKEQWAQTKIAPELQDKLQFYQAFNAQKQNIGTAIRATSPIKGFGGPVVIVAGFSPEGKILGVIVAHHEETPGLGTKATDRENQRSLWDLFRSQMKTEDSAPYLPNPFLDSFSGHSSLETVHKLPLVTGATYSSKATRSAVETALQGWQALHAIQLL